MARVINNLEQPHPVDSLAERANYSRRHFTREFRAVTGVSPHKWLLFQRLGLAQELLETTKLPVEEIATRCGFNSGTLLRRHFQQTFHTTPRDYRHRFTH